MRTLELKLAADHPATRGHFPGNPIIPGAVLLSTALSELGRALGRDLARCQISSAKFLNPARPGDCVEMEYTVSGPRIVLLCSVEKRAVLKADLMCTADGE
ncbi:MAG: hypothetical protein V4637_07785 [Pseudomonadota bacterium]